eukprot:1149574-Pelagomonas_calceolata.AAC.1
MERKEKTTHAKRLHALRKGSQTSELARISLMDPQASSDIVSLKKSQRRRQLDLSFVSQTPDPIL